ncbi:hypothetical protein WA158_002254 [Blastocystis sp. Blastoise]
MAKETSKKQKAPSDGKCWSCCLNTFFVPIFLTIIGTAVFTFCWGSFHELNINSAFYVYLYILAGVIGIALIVMLFVTCFIRCCKNRSSIAFAIILSTISIFVLSTITGGLFISYTSFKNRPEELSVYDAIIEDVHNYTTTNPTEWISFQDLHSCCGFDYLEDVKTGEMCKKPESEQVNCYTLFHDDYTFYILLFFFEFACLDIFQIISLFSLIINLTCNSNKKSNDSDEVSTPLIEIN